MRRPGTYKMRFGAVSSLLERRMLQKVLTLADMEAMSEKRMSLIAHAYVSGAAGDEITLRANKEQWSRICLNPNILVDVSEIGLSTRILGETFELPILLAPAAINRCGTARERWLWLQEPIRVKSR